MPVHRSFSFFSQDIGANITEENVAPEKSS